MALPNHYSRDIVIRCQYLIQHLLPQIEGGLPDDSQFGGSVRTTFLLAMATPMIILPIERIFKTRNPSAQQVGDDRELNPTVAGEVDRVLGGTLNFGEAPFAGTGRWSYVHEYPKFNIASDWPSDLLDRLSEPDAIDAARNAPASRILLDLRNALAHGGIAYLDVNGRITDDQAEMFAFVGAVIRNQQIVGLNVLRVHEDDFSAFLNAWTEWLSQTTILSGINTQSALAE